MGSLDPKQMERPHAKYILPYSRYEERAPVMNPSCTSSIVLESCLIYSSRAILYQHTDFAQCVGPQLKSRIAPETALKSHMARVYSAYQSDHLLYRTFAHRYKSGCREFGCVQISLRDGNSRLVHSDMYSNASFSDSC